MSGGEKKTSQLSSILFQSDDKSVVLLDIPRSIEEGQVLPHQTPQRRIYSDAPPLEPFPTPDPKRSRGGSNQHGSAAHAWPTQHPAAQIADLMTAASVESALKVLADNYNGPFHHRRIISPRKTVDNTSTAGAVDGSSIAVQDAVPLHGSIQHMRQRLIDTAPKFKLIVLDPPWPNRSAKRRTEKYATVASLADMQTLLTSIPIATHLAEDGLVAVWITNKASIPDLLTSPTGIFSSWGVELVAEWTWLKVTASGEPLYSIDSTWRKPWEKILIARRIRGPMAANARSKIIVAAPDIHSRKPNLRGLFQEVLGEVNYPGLEIFARNLTAGWWSWGDQVLQFQGQQHWHWNRKDDDSEDV